MKNRLFCFMLMVICMLVIPVGSCALDYQDGTYIGHAIGFGAVTVTLTIQNGFIASVTVDAPQETIGIADPAIEQLPKRIIAANTAEGIDTIAGATVTSRAILNAAMSCLDQACGGSLVTPSPSPSPTPTPTLTPPPAVSHPEYHDGTYIGHAIGFGAVTVTLTIQNGFIASVTVDAPQETIGIADPAIEQLPKRIIAANTAEGIDTIAGATVTSRAILNAAMSCLDQACGGSLVTPSPSPSPTPTPTPTPPPAVSHPEYHDGLYTGSAEGVGTVTVMALFSDGRIVSLWVDASQETQGIGSIAAEQLPERIIAANGADGVDVISGATVTSRAVLNAVKSCIRQSVSSVKDSSVLLLPSGLSAVSAEAFCGVPAENIVIPDGCSSIASRAFADCTALTRIVIPDSVTQIDDDAFSGCGSLSIITSKGSAAASFAARHQMSVIVY